MTKPGCYIAFISMLQIVVGLFHACIYNVHIARPHFAERPLYAFIYNHCQVGIGHVLGNVVKVEGQMNFTCLYIQIDILGLILCPYFGNLGQLFCPYFADLG